METQHHRELSGPSSSSSWMLAEPQQNPLSYGLGCVAQGMPQVLADVTVQTLKEPKDNY